MKKVILVLAVVAVSMAGCSRCDKTREVVVVEEVAVATQDMHTSQNSLDYVGVYKGTLPCADCAGIETQIELKNDGTYTFKTKYLGEEDGSESVESGHYTWNAEGSAIVLSGRQIPNMYKVGENVLFLLDQQGNVITGDLADNYKLEKVE